MDIEKLLRISRDENDKDILGMILSNRTTHFLNEKEGVAISSTNFDVIVDDLIAFINSKNRKHIDVLESAAKLYRDAEDSNASPPKEWPWAEKLWEPSDRISNLKRSKALYVASASIAERSGLLEDRDRLCNEIEKVNGLISSL